jgi:hypothetical protein
MRIFISSTRAGLEEERDALPGLITALGHDPVVFEQFTAQAVPSREACLAAVQSAHAYLLLLGPRYGYQWEETGLSATHEEYRAARARGIRRVAFRKLGVDVEPRQQAFIEEVEAYASGLFRASFRTMAELLIEVAKVVRELEQGPAPLAWRRLPALAEVAWRRDTAGGRPGRSPGGEHVFEIYIRPVSPVYRTATQLRTDARRVAEVMRSLGMVDQSRPLHSDATASHAVVEVGPADAGRRHWNEPIAREVRGVEVSHDGQICVWQTVPRDSMGTLVDEALLAAAAADALRFAGQLGIVRDADEVVVAGSLHPLTMLAEGNPSTIGYRSRASMPTYRGEEARTSTADAVTATALDVGAAEAGRELSLRMLDALRRAGQVWT